MKGRTLPLDGNHGYEIDSRSFARVKDPQAERCVSPAGEHTNEGAQCHRPRRLDDTL